MHKTAHRRNHSDYDLYGDLARIKSAIFRASHDLKGKAGEIWADSIDNVKEKSSLAQENATDYITEKPFKSVGIALLAGVVLGFFLRK